MNELTGERTPARSPYLTAVLDRIAMRVGQEDAALAVQFGEIFWGRVPEVEFDGRRADDDAAVTVELWQTLTAHDPDAVSVRLRNAVHARDGWESEHTVVVVVAPNAPFVVDSVLMALSHDGQVTHQFNNCVLAVDRTPDGRVTALSDSQTHPTREVMVYAEIDRLTDDEVPALQGRLEEAMADLGAVVSDFDAMKLRLQSAVDEIKGAVLPVPDAERTEAIAFLEWFGANHFTFLGCRDFDYTGGTVTQTGQALGTLRRRRPASERRLDDQPASTTEFLLGKRVLAFSKSGTKSLVHRPAYPDYVGIKRFDADGNVVGECGFLGLYTSLAYRANALEVPVIRQKVANVMDRSGLDANGFDGKVLAQVLATYPRDELFQIEEGELLETALDVTYIHERRRIRLFLRHAPYGLFVNCLLYVPRDLFSTHVRQRIQQLLVRAFDAVDAEFDLHFSESILVRLQINLRIKPGSDPQVDVGALEQEVTRLTGDWLTEFHAALRTGFGESEGRKLARRYQNAFRAGYRDTYTPRAAIDDVGAIESLDDARRLLIRLYKKPEDDAGRYRLKLFHLGTPLALSEVVPALENMGLRVAGDEVHVVRRDGEASVVVQDFELGYDGAFDLNEAAPRFEAAFQRVWAAVSENDGYNRLVLSAGLTWLEVSALRTYARYLKQIRLGFSQEFIAATLATHSSVAAGLIAYFTARFDRSSDSQALKHDLLSRIDAVEILNEDRVLRRFLDVIDATTRTNFHAIVPAEFAYVAIKLVPSAIPGLPRPVPAHEIFVCGPAFEGVHLRGGAIARGGLRWSDRLEDFRTEILGLVKAQVVKNAVIVPTGAKGGFVIKQGDDVRACYRQFIGGLLDLTDNIVDGAVVPAPNIVRLDGDDPYLVVAADKGTATFSDVANEIALARGFWLGDAFASGGSNGYDHKKMGITARGAWVSVRRHFIERDVDVQRDPVTVLGIGDMGGDVFGNGLLRSRSVLLVAAFNHRHIFLDPNPDAAASYLERERLFADAAGWDAYDRTVVSEGGGIYERSEKSIAISDTVRARFEIEAAALAPDELISALLASPVGLIWNGGIGTYVKATSETHDAVGDRANDALRIDAAALGCRVFGEGGNLGLTQLARVEFGMVGGGVNTDFIDNSAGVDCSDHEVNIKIVLNELVAREELTNKQRNELLEAMTDDVAELVLTNSAQQTRTLSLAERHVGGRAPEYGRFVGLLERHMDLDRALEGLPDDDTLIERFQDGESLTRPELATVLAYSKIHISDALLESNIDEDSAAARAIFGAFPERLVSEYRARIEQHPLRREIIATQLANDVVHQMGITFVAHMIEFVGGTVPEVLKGFLAIREIFGLDALFEELAAADVPEALKLDAGVELITLGRRSARWLLRRDMQTDTAEVVEHFKARTQALIADRETFARSTVADEWHAEVQELIRAGLDPSLARRTARAAELSALLPIIDAADRSGIEPRVLAEGYAVLGRELSLDWLADAICDLPIDTHWQAIEKETLLDQLAVAQGALAAQALGAGGSAERWLTYDNPFVAAWERLIGEAEQARFQDLSLFSITCRKLGELVAAL